MSTYWLIWLGVLVLGGFAVPEAYAITRRQWAGTLTDNIRSWLRTDTPGGGWTFAGVWLALLGVWGWFLGHILRWWP